MPRLRTTNSEPLLSGENNTSYQTFAHAVFYNIFIQLGLVCNPFNSSFFLDSPSTSSGRSKKIKASEKWLKITTQSYRQRTRLTDTFNSKIPRAQTTPAPFLLRRKTDCSVIFLIPLSSGTGCHFSEAVKLLRTTMTTNY